jgi:hypothetical protein
MVTSRKDLARKHRHRPWPLRVALVFLGLFLIIIGTALWSLETEYGGDSDRPEFVIGHDSEPGAAFVYGEGGEVIYETSSIADAEAYVDGFRGTRNYTVPILILGVGVLSLLVALVPSPQQRLLESPSPTGPNGGPSTAQH